MTRRTFLAALAATPVRADDRAKQVVDDAVAALGGPRFLAMRDRIEAGRAYSFYREQLSGLALAKIYTRYLIRPEPPVAGFFGVRERQAFGKNEESLVLFNETGGWNITFRGAKPVPEQTLERYRESTLRNALYWLRQRLGEPGMSMDSKGSDVVENAPVDIVELADSDRWVVTVYFHSSTKLPLRQVTMRREAGSDRPLEEITMFSKYRDIGGGVHWPYQIQRFRDGEKTFEIFSESVVINSDLTDNIFTLDAKMKVLPAKK